MHTLLEYCDDLYCKLPCCHGTFHTCSCGDCWKDDFYHRPDSYSCLKKLCFYTMNYGPAYASEIYHYLEKSQILENNFDGYEINVLSLGCGFSPDLYALEKYIKDNDLDIEIIYTGYDFEKNWEKIWEDVDNRQYEIRNLLAGFSLRNYDIIFLCKVFSTIRRNNYTNALKFLNLVKSEISKMDTGSFIIFDDVNLDSFGRDEFNNAIANLFSNVRKYYFPVDSKTYRGNGFYTRIDRMDNVFHIPDTLSIDPKLDVFKTIIFEYRK